MTSIGASKRIKLSKENDLKMTRNSIAESGFHSEIDFSSNQTSDFSLPLVKRKSPAPRRASLQQISLNTTGNITQQSSGYSSLHSSSSSNITATCSSTSLASRASRTPKKRKSEISESDENFYNSFQFVSPVKQRKKDTNEKNCAKLVLKDKCPSENIILCSTPIRSNKTTKWKKFRSFHPEKFQIGKSLDDDEPIQKIISTPPIKSLVEDSINLSSIDFSNLSSGNFTHSIQQDIPADIQNLWTDNIKQSKSVTFDTSESQEIKSKPQSSGVEKKKFYNGRIKYDILGSLNEKKDIAVDEILSYLDAETLLSLSHVCMGYRHMIQSNKNYETKRQNYLKTHRAIKENKLPSRYKTLNDTSRQENVSGIIPAKEKKKAFGSNSLNITMNKQNTPSSPPRSPNSRRFKEMQKIIESHKTSTFKKCPRCRKLATIKSIKIRNSPRKKKSKSLYKLSTTTGRIQKKAFLSKTSIPENSFHEAISNSHFVTLPNFDDDSSRSPTNSDSPNSSGSDESNCEMEEIYEYGICSAIGCSYKFCIKCNCKYHPRRICGDLSPPSPSRSFNNHNHSRNLAGTKASRKSLMRLIQY